MGMRLIPGAPWILDTFCGGGGAAVGYYRAGFNVVGVDINPQPRYPFRFILDDAMDCLEMLAWDGCYDMPPYDRHEFRHIHVSELAAIHASPPCQAYSVATKCRPGLAEKYPKLIGPVRELLKGIGLPYIIENVPGAPLHDPVWLCGCQFGCFTEWPGKGLVRLQRKRGFETNWRLPQPSCHHHSHAIKSIPVFGHNAPGNRPDLRGRGYAKAAREVMGIDWMNREEMAEAIPPVYTNYVGNHLWNWLASQGSEIAA